jgi:tetratricopeptide (TPR) repeat protein
MELIVMSHIINEAEIIKLLRKLSVALKANDESAIYSVIDAAGMDLIFSEKSIGLARAIRDVRLTVFLLNIAKENNISGKKNTHWFELYNSINKGVFPSKKLKHSTSLVLKSIIEKKNLTNQELVGVRFDNFDGSDLELAVDFRKWSFVSAILNSLITSGEGVYHCLSFLKTIVERQRFISNANDGKNFAEIYKLIIQKLSHVDALKSSLNVIKLLYANSLQISGDFNSALLLYEELDASNNSIAVILEKARCHSKLGNYLESLRLLDLLISKLLDNYSRGESVPVLLQNPSDLNYSMSNAVAAYSDIVSLAKIAKAKLFMVSGTLLGYCRISNFLPNDKDLDFGLIGLDNLAPLVDLALKSGLFQIGPEYFKGVDTIQVPFIHVPTGIWIDVFIYHEKDDKFVTGVDFQFGYRQTFKFSKFEPIQVDFHNLKTYIPSNFDENLRENFSNWMQPDVNYISHVESPSLMDYGGISHQMTSRFWLIKSIQSKSKEKFQKVLKVIDDISKFEGGLSSELVRNLLIRKDDIFSKNKFNKI